jgi:hypothetical protein
MSLAAIRAHPEYGRRVSLHNVKVEYKMEGEVSNSKNKAYRVRMSLFYIQHGHHTGTRRNDDPDEQSAFESAA